jgi:His-Xaa-Ser system radical SAM maturase HxsC
VLLRKNGVRAGRGIGTGHPTRDRHSVSNPTDVRTVFKLRSPISAPQQSSDVALIRHTDELGDVQSSGFQTAIIVSENEALLVALALPRRVIQLGNQFDYLADGDVLGFDPASKRFRTIYRRASAHNSFLVTERCNHYCLMCSQPPRDVDDQWIMREIRDALPLIDKQTKTMGFTGGEPLLNWQEFIAILAICRDVLPQTAVHVLSNGRAFALTEIVDAWAGIKHPNLMVGIPIYSAVDTVHDYEVQAKGAFDETVLGVLKLKDRGQRVEIRVVLHAITAPRLLTTCKWLARNLPFVDHVALMGLENTGFAIANDDLLWIDPLDYKEQLTNSVEVLTASKVRVSVYNLPRCLLDRSVWPFARQSISDWKNGFFAECDLCDEKLRCSGFFTTGRPHYSRGIRAITGTTVPLNAVPA